MLSNCLVHADTSHMARTRTRTRTRRAADLGIAVVGVVLVLSPFIAQSFAGDAIIEQRIAVGQRIKAAAVVSPPATGRFVMDSGGLTTGAVSWDVFTTDSGGFRMTVNTDANEEALRDRTTGLSVADYSHSSSEWSVPAGQRRFGFSAVGDYALNEYGDGSKWRGFEGRRGVLVARHGSGAAPMSRVTLRLASEMKSPLPDSANPKAYIYSTVTVNI